MKAWANKSLYEGLVKARQAAAVVGAAVVWVWEDMLLQAMIEKIDWDIDSLSCRLGIGFGKMEWDVWGRLALVLGCRFEICKQVE